MRRHLPVLALLAALLLPAAPAFAAATIVIVNTDGPGEGFNDPTPRAPEGGNPGTTLGEQRLNTFNEAARIWGELLNSVVTIRIQAAFNPLTCAPTTGTLGSARALAIFSNFSGAPVVNTWYPVALANRLSYGDLAPDPGSAPGFPTDDLVATFNSSIGLPGCLTGNDWYYGFDNNEGAGRFDLLAVLLHEFGHGLGFASFANKTTGAYAGSPLLPDIYLRFLFDNRLGLHWDQMTDAQRASSILDYNRVVWSGPTVTAAVPSTLTPPAPDLRINSSPIALVPYTPLGLAVFGPPLASPGITGNLVQALDAADAVGPTTFDACSPLTNAAAVAGNIALVDRGGNNCGFILKVKNAQNAGAIAVVVADNVVGAPPAALGGADPTIIIPSARITLPDANAIKAAIAAGTVNVTLGLNASLRRGADHLGRVLMYCPVPLASGSSISHWDVSATPNLLMEPFINTDLTTNVDLTLPLFHDLGWSPDEVTESLYLHGSGATANPATLFLDTTVSTAATAKYKDSAGINFNGGNPWKAIGTWTAAPSLSAGQLHTLADLHVWLGLKNSDDQGTRFDLRAEVYKNGTLLSAGETYCVTGITRNADLAKEVVVAFGAISPDNFNRTTDVLSLKVSTRIGTNGTGGFCGGHSNAVGARLYFDAVSRPSQLAGTFEP